MNLVADARPYTSGLKAALAAVARLKESAVPFSVRKVQGGYKVFGPGGAKSAKPMPKAKAEAQMRALYANVPDARKKKG